MLYPYLAHVILWVRYGHGVGSVCAMLIHGQKPGKHLACYQQDAYTALYIHDKFYPTESYAVQEMDTLTDELAKHHPFG